MKIQAQGCNARKTNKVNAVPVLNDATYVIEGTGESGGMDPHIVNYSGRNQLHVPAASSPVPPEKGLG